MTKILEAKSLFTFYLLSISYTDWYSVRITGGRYNKNKSGKNTSKTVLILIN